MQRLITDQHGEDTGLKMEHLYHAPSPQSSEAIIEEGVARAEVVDICREAVFAGYARARPLHVDSQQL